MILRLSWSYGGGYKGKGYRKEILAEPKHPGKARDLRTRLAEKKKARIAVDYPTCPYNAPKGATGQVKATSCPRSRRRRMRLWRHRFAVANLDHLGLLRR